MTYERIYRLVGFSLIGLIVLYFSVELSRSMGWVGLVLPSLLIATAYIIVTVILDAVLLWLQSRLPERRRKSR
ncbi:MAG: hypothetical protein DIU68_012395 [Chloroflexota bacterium]|nr:MAG: hypothetical protein DIU68_00655 [Chloroflexota bacterium]